MAPAESVNPSHNQELTMSIIPDNIGILHFLRTVAVAKNEMEECLRKGGTEHEAEGQHLNAARRGSNRCRRGSLSQTWPPSH